MTYEILKNFNREKQAKQKSNFTILSLKTCLKGLNSMGEWVKKILMSHGCKFQKVCPMPICTGPLCSICWD